MPAWIGPGRELWRTVKRAAVTRRYRSVDRIEVDVGGTRVSFSTSDPYSKTWFFPRYAGGRLHEERVTRLLLEELATARCFVDVGAHLGWFTCLASKHRPGATVHAFEMDPANYALLAANVHLNRCTNVELRHAAVADTPGRRSYVKRSAEPSPFLALGSGSTGDPGGVQLEVDTVTLDGVFGSAATPPDVVKIDVEGAEHLVLRGMQGLVARRAPTLFVEVHPRGLRRLGSTCAEVVSELISSRYTVFSLGRRGAGSDQPLEPVTPATPFAGATMLYARR